ncbi:unnamed protein product [Notodromas monacha]|uniref:Cysteine and histidine-rich domain-containing protein 1 n=1 Tax=Notodromas monacha TaxID=399045 RepID=A0A7R9G8M9_9CRUS|nr:unnamed protein product [Notodromas monacha]CAG0913384.1 unnamed protein product [Notodromas monacha]
MKMSEKDLLFCYNQGCGKQFDPLENTEDSCLFHPGAPFFHDAYKGWSCCKKRSVDFTEFLNTKGCAKGPHNPVKPPEPEKRERGSQDVVIHERKPLQKDDTEYGDANDSTTALIVTVSPALRKLLDDEASTKPTQNDVSVGGGEVVEGTACKNAGCLVTYREPPADLGSCVHHPGTAIFHEGMKYWSCCKRKTTDFTVFLNQKGCVSGEHAWSAPSKRGEKVNCRHDWHQTGPYVFITYYAKKVDPKQCVFNANSAKLELQLTFEGKLFAHTILLRGPISPEESTVTLGGSKVEIKLKKANAMSWKDLGEFVVDNEEPEHKAEESSNTVEDIPDVDLNDL